MVDTGLIPSAARSFHVPTQRVETRKRGNYDIAPVFHREFFFCRMMILILFSTTTTILIG